MRKECLICGEPTLEHFFEQNEVRRTRRYVCPQHRDQLIKSKAEAGIELHIPRVRKPKAVPVQPPRKPPPARPCLHCAAMTVKFVMVLHKVRMRKRHFCSDECREEFTSPQKTQNQPTVRATVPPLPLVPSFCPRRAVLRPAAPEPNFSIHPAVRRYDELHSKCDGSTWSDVLYSLEN